MTSISVLISPLISSLRAVFLASALFLSSALASPAMANVMTELSPRQIASDVQVQRNSQSGSVEYIAPSFDPFEANYELAGLASLRSTAGATSINGQRLGSGALLDLSLFYSTANNLSLIHI